MGEDDLRNDTDEVVDRVDVLVVELMLVLVLMAFVEVEDEVLDALELAFNLVEIELACDVVLETDAAEDSLMIILEEATVALEVEPATEVVEDNGVSTVELVIRVAEVILLPDDVLVFDFNAGVVWVIGTAVVVLFAFVELEVIMLVAVKFDMLVLDALEVTTVLLDLEGLRLVLVATVEFKRMVVELDVLGIVLLNTEVPDVVLLAEVEFVIMLVEVAIGGVELVIVVFCVPAVVLEVAEEEIVVEGAEVLAADVIGTVTGPVSVMFAAQTVSY